MDELYQEAMKKGIEVVLENYIDPLLHRIGDKIRGAAKTAAREISVDTNLAFREYLKKAFDSCSRVKTVLYRSKPKYLYDFFEVPSVKRAENFLIPESRQLSSEALDWSYQVYVMLQTLHRQRNYGSITPENIDVGIPGKSSYLNEITRLERMKRNGMKANTLQDLLVLTDNSNFIILRGTGGIGKSTLMKHLFLDELSRKDLIPVYLQLKDLNGMTGELNLQRFILEAFCRFGCDLDTSSLEYALESGCFLFLLDGYDEIVSDYSGEFFKKLGAFCDRYPDNYFIVSSRPRKESDFIGGGRFTVLEACPFDLPEAVSLIRKTDYDVSVRNRFVDALQARLYNKHPTFASNPLLLIVMLMTFDNYAEIPEKLHVFYASAFEAMYQKHDATKDGYKRERKSGIRDYDDFRMIFACFCFISYAWGETEFSWDHLAAIFQQVKEMPFCKSDFSIEDYVDDLEGLCVLYQEGTQYLFTHRSFQEYFTAVFLTRQSDENMEDLSLQLIENDVQRALNDEVFRLVGGIDEDRFQDNIILPILRDFESKIPDGKLSNQERFDYYFRNLFSKIKYDFGISDNYERWGGKDFKTFDFLKIDRYSKIWFAYGIMTFFPARIVFDNSKKNTNIYDTQLLDYLRKNPRYTGHRKHHYIKSIDVETMLKDVNALRLLLETPVGYRVMQFAHLREQIEAQKKKRSMNLSNLMKRKE